MTSRLLARKFEIALQGVEQAVAQSVHALTPGTEIRHVYTGMLGRVHRKLEQAEGKVPLPTHEAIEKAVARIVAIRNDRIHEAIDQLQPKPRSIPTLRAPANVQRMQEFIRNCLHDGHVKRYQYAVNSGLLLVQRLQEAAPSTLEDVDLVLEGDEGDHPGRDEPAAQDANKWGNAWASKPRLGTNN